MTNFKHLQSMSIDELAEWLDENGMWDYSPWSQWFDCTYCKNCEDVKKECEFNGHYTEMRFAWCEIHNRCKFFPDHDEVPDCNEIIKIWLESEAADEEII